MSDMKSAEIQYGERIGSGGSDAILSSYFRDILKDLHIDTNRFLALLDKYIIREGLASNTAEISTSRSAFRRELLNPTMTWKVFLKGLKFLKVTNIIMSVTMFRDDSKTTIHEYEFAISDELVKDESANSKDANVLELFLRQILDELKINDEQFSDYLDHYVKISKPGSTPVDQYTTKCSLRREILKDYISWKIFIKGILFLRTYKMIFHLNLLYENKLISTHQKTLVFR